MQFVGGKCPALYLESAKYLTQFPWWHFKRVMIQITPVTERNYSNTSKAHNRTIPMRSKTKEIQFAFKNIFVFGIKLSRLLQPNPMPAMYDSNCCSRRNVIYLWYLHALSDKYFAHMQRRFLAECWLTPVNKLACINYRPVFVEASRFVPSGATCNEK